MVSVLNHEPKSENRHTDDNETGRWTVSVLNHEPKSENPTAHGDSTTDNPAFQCSTTSRRAKTGPGRLPAAVRRVGFSAQPRAEERKRCAHSFGCLPC